MRLLAADLEYAAMAAHDRLSHEASGAAGAQSAAAAQAVMASSAEEALFEQALLGAAKAEFNEIKTVTR